MFRILNIFYVVTGLILVIFAGKINAQDVQFSQLFSDRLYLNPAFAGADYCPNLRLSYRNQWPGLQFPYTTYSASIDKYSEFLHGGFGIRIMKDDQGAGVFKQLNLDLIYAYKVNLSSKSNLKLALEASIYQKSINTSGLVFADMIDPRFGVRFPNSENISNQAIFSPDFSTAFLYQYSLYFAGLNVSHLPISIVAGHNELFPMKFTAHAGAAIPIIKNDEKRPRYVLEPNIVYIQQQDFQQLYYGMYFDISKMTFGMFYRQDLKLHFDAMVLSWHIDIKKLRIGYSYDLSLSRMLMHSLGSHELSLSYLFECDKKIKNYKTISCPVY